MSPEPALIRFMLHVDDGPLGQIACSYLQAVADAGIAVSALPLISGRFLPGSPWNQLTKHFQTTTAERFLNIVIGQGDAFAKGWTLGVPNIAILVPPLHFRSASDRKALFRYDDTLVPSLEILQHPWAKHYGFDVPAASSLVPPSKLVAFCKKYRKYLRGEEAWTRELSEADRLDERKKAAAFAAQYIEASHNPEIEGAMDLLLKSDAPMSGGGEPIE